MTVREISREKPVSTASLGTLEKLPIMIKLAQPRLLDELNETPSQSD